MKGQLRAERTSEGALTPATMKAAAIDHFGPPSAITLHTVPVPEPGPNEVLIEMQAAGVGSWDESIRDGSWKLAAHGRSRATPAQFPSGRRLRGHRTDRRAGRQCPRSAKRPDRADLRRVRGGRLAGAAVRAGARGAGDCYRLWSIGRWRREEARCSRRDRRTTFRCGGSSPHAGS
jgi:hypothetical protein